MMGPDSNRDMLQRTLEKLGLDIVVADHQTCVSEYSGQFDVLFFDADDGAYLSQDRIDLADKVSGRARAAGCFDRPADQQLCDLLSRQEQEYNLSGRMDLVNIVRGQERDLLCFSEGHLDGKGPEGQA